MPDVVTGGIWNDVLAHVPRILWSKFMLSTHILGEIETQERSVFQSHTARIWTGEAACSGEAAWCHRQIMGFKFKGWNQSLSYTSCMTLAKLCNISGFQHHLLYNGNNETFFIRLLWELNHTHTHRHIQLLTQCLDSNRSNNNNNI